MAKQELIWDAAYEHAATVYKQIPGADIEPGWYAVMHRSDRNWPSQYDEHLGPYHYKREAMQAAQRHLSKSRRKQ